MKEKFEYKYESPTIEEKKEIESIRKQYLPKESCQSKIEQLKELDKKVKNIPTILGLSCGIFGVLLFGLGMSFFLEIVEYWYLGIPSSILGTIVMLLSYPVYNSVHSKLRNKYGQKIIELSDEILMNDK